MSNLRWGIIGCGDVCEVKSGPALQKATGSKLVVVCRRQADLARDFAQRHGVPRSTGDPQAVIDDPEVDAVYIATPPGSHLDYARRVAAAGKPCYVEKPMARTHAECVAMNQAFADAGQKLFVAYYRRCLPRFVAVQEMLAQGRIGTVRSVDSVQTTNHMLTTDPDDLPWRLQAPHSGGGLLLDMGSHTLDVLDLLLGPITQARGTARRASPGHGVADQVEAELAFGDQITGTARWDFASDGPRTNAVVIHGSRGSIRFAVYDDNAVTLIADGETTVTDHPDPPHVHQPLVQTMVDELAGKGTCPSTGVSAARTSAVMDDLTRAYYGNRDAGFWDRPDAWGC